MKSESFITSGNKNKQDNELQIDLDSDQSHIDKVISNI